MGRGRIHKEPVLRRIRVSARHASESASRDFNGEVASSRSQGREGTTSMTMKPTRSTGDN